MSRKTFLGVMVVALVTMLTVGVVIASNIGFKLNYSLQRASAGVSKTGSNMLALPDNRQSGMNTGKALMDDIGFASVTNVQRYVESNDTFVAYTGRSPQTPASDFSLVSGDGYRVRMTTTTSYIIVGSDDPALTYNLNRAAAGVSKTGSNLYAYNYHQTAGTAKALMDDIGFASVTNVQRYVKSNDTFVAYTGRSPQTPASDFALVVGEAYRVRMNTTTAYSPSHY